MKQKKGKLHKKKRWCIFCQKTTKFLRGQKSRESLIQCRELRADSSIRKAAVQKMDGRMLAIVSRDLVAAEGHYHRSCMRQEKVCSSRNYAEDSQEGEYEKALSHSYDELFMYIRNELFTNPKVIAMSDLTSRFVTAMKACGIDQVKDSSKKHLRRKLESVFGQALHIFSDDKGKLFLYPDNLSVIELARANIALRRELQSLKSLTHDNVISTAALKIREDIEQHDFPQAWPPHIVEGDESAFIVPGSLLLFLQYLLTGSKGYDSRRTQRLMTSFGSDLLYAVTHGEKKPPNHTFAVKSLTGNVELIKTLNRLGHCISYSQMEEIDTALCLLKISLSENVALPTTLHPTIFTTLAWDNIDRLEETIGGQGTSHRVNGIAIQAKAANLEPVESLLVLRKQRKEA